MYVVRYTCLFSLAAQAGLMELVGGVEENVCDSQKRLKVANFMSKPAGCAT